MAARLTLNERLTSIRLTYLCHRIAGLRWIGRRISPSWFFKWTQFTAFLAYYIYPPDRRRIGYLRRAMSGTFDDRKIDLVGRRNIVYRKWSKHLVYAWPNWADRLPDWVSLEGEEHLARALDGGRGVILLSGHAYGFAAFVPPVLAQKGYRVYRMGDGQRNDQRTRWGAEGDYERWHYISYGENSWNHLQALNGMREALKENEVAHVSIQGAPHGDSRLQIDFYYKGFFLDSRLLRIIEIIEAPVVPCFAVCGDDGRLLVKMYAPLEPSTEEIMRVFGPLYAHYLRESPEFTRIWRRLVRQQEGW